MTKVKVFEWKKVEGKNHFEKVERCYASFLQFGVDFEELETGVGTYSTAIIEHADGTVENVPVELIQFVVDP